MADVKFRVIIVSSGRIGVTGGISRAGSQHGI